MNRLLLKFLVLIMVTLCAPWSLLAVRNAPVTRVISKTACSGTQVVVPVTVNGFISIKAITLRFEYDNSVMTFVSGTPNSLLPSAGANVTFYSSQVSGNTYRVMMVWSSPFLAKTLNQPDTLAWLRFNVISGTTSVTLNNSANNGGDCEYADESLKAMTDTPTENYYYNGSVSPKVVIGPAGAISGAATVTQGDTGVSYSVPAIANATGYQWTLPSGAAITSGSNTNSITVAFTATATTGAFYVAGTNSGCTGAMSAGFTVTVNPPRVARNAPVTAVLSKTVCPGTQVIVPVTVTGFTDINAVTLRMEYDNTVLSYDTGEANPILSQASGVLITSSVVTGTTSMIRVVWSSILSRSLALPTDTIIKLTFNYTTGTTTLTFNNTTSGGQDCEYTEGMPPWPMVDTPTESYYFNGAVSPTAVVGAAGAISGAATVTQGDAGVSYSVPSIANATGYQWTLPSGAAITSGSNTSSITVAFTATATTGAFYVAGTNSGCTGATSAAFTVTVVSAIPSVLTLTNVTVGSGESNCYNALQTITVAGGGTYFTVQPGGSATLIASQSVFLLPGTSVMSGGYLDARITTDGSYCNLTASPLPAAQILNENGAFTKFTDHSLPLRIWPNPTTGRFIVELEADSGNPTGTLLIYGMLGEILTSYKFQGDLHQEFSLDGYPAGIYFIRIMAGERTETRKVLKR